MIKIMIGIQARSTSKRLPQKSIALVDTQTVTDHVLTSCLSAADHISKQKTKIPLHAQTVLLVPNGDQLKGLFIDKVDVVEGPEDDVLSRYMLAIDKYKPDYVARITADCAMIHPPIISKHVLSAVFDKLDYCSNVYEDSRSYLDGWDVEVISAELMDWAHKNAIDVYDREHVTTKIRSKMPDWAKVGSVIGYVDMSDFKLSVDTSEDLERVRLNKRAINSKLNIAKQRGHIYRF